MIPDFRARQPRDGPMQCGNRPADISVIHRRYKLRASRSPSGVTHTRISTGSRTIASDALAPVDTCRPYQSLDSVTTDYTRRRRSNGKRLIWISGDTRDRLPGPGARPTHDRLPAVHRHSDRRHPRSSNEGQRSRRFGESRVWVRRDRFFDDGADAAVSSEVSTMVVRLEPRPDEVQHPRRHLSGAVTRRVSLDG